MRLAATLEPGSPFVFHDLGLDFLKAGFPAEAATAFRRAIHNKPDFAHAFWRLGVALEQCEDADGAVVALKKATDLQPRLPEAPTPSWNVARTARLSY